MEKEFNVIMKHQCKTCGISVVEVNEDDNCVDCWHKDIAKEFPHICKTKGIWKAYKSRDAMPSPTGNW